MFSQVIRHACACICLFAAVGQSATLAFGSQEESEARQASRPQTAPIFSRKFNPEQPA